MELNPELILEDARSIQEGLWRMARYAQDAAETLDARIEDEDLKRLDAPGVRGTLKQLARLGEIFVISDEGVALSVVRLPGVPSADSDGWPAVVGRPARDRGVHFQLTGAMAVVVSKDSVARVFDDGRLVREISPGRESDPTLRERRYS